MSLESPKEEDKGLLLDILRTIQQKNFNRIVICKEVEPKMKL